MTLEELELRLEELYDAADKRQSEAVDEMARVFAIYRDLEDLEYAITMDQEATVFRLLDKVSTGINLRDV